MTGIYDIPLKRIDGTPVTLEAFKGKVLLAVNVASKCGLTPQYESLEALYREKSGEGLEILGFPANNFLAQEPGTEEEIANFCSTTSPFLPIRNFSKFHRTSPSGLTGMPNFSRRSRIGPALTASG